MHDLRIHCGEKCGESRRAELSELGESYRLLPSLTAVPQANRADRKRVAVRGHCRLQGSQPVGHLQWRSSLPLSWKLVCRDKPMAPHSFNPRSTGCKSFSTFWWKKSCLSIFKLDTDVRLVAFPKW
jgi:hypothetical protein